MYLVFYLWFFAFAILWEKKLYLANTALGRSTQSNHTKFKGFSGTSGWKYYMYILGKLPYLYRLNGHVCIEFGVGSLLFIYEMADNNMEFPTQPRGLKIQGMNSMALSTILVHKLRWQDFARYWPPTYPLLTFEMEFLYCYWENLHTIKISSTIYLPRLVLTSINTCY